MVLLSRGEGEEVVSSGEEGFGFGFDAGCLSEGRFLVLGFLGFGRGGIFSFSFLVVMVVMLNFFGSGPRTDN